MTEETKHIIYIEDEPEMIDLVRLILNRKGYEVKGALGGQEGLDLIRSYHPDLVLLDLMMPEIDGFAVCETLRSNPMTASVPIIILTAVTSQMSRFSGLEVGADDYLTKPFSPKQLVARVNEMLAGR